MTKVKNEEVTIESLQEQIKFIEGVAKSQQEEITAQAELIAELREELKKATAGGTATVPTFEHKGKVYSILAKKFRLGDKLYTAADLQTDTALQAELIKMGAGVIAEVTE